MPPKGKAQPSAGDKKKMQAAKQKVADDKTFGLKNKNKSKSVQKYISQVNQMVDGGLEDKSARRAKLDKEKKEAAKRDMDAILKPVITQTKCPEGVDPKSLLCEFFKRGQCQKGSKCKFSHDLNVERKGAKINVYADQRDVPKEKEETMEDWDQAKLEEVIKAKNSKGQRCKSDIICKHFLEVIEKSQYGWNWVCPNGGDQCQYRHALPEGYVLKKDQVAEEDLDSDMTIEQQIEEERKKLIHRTPMTKDAFFAWIARKKAEKQAIEDAKVEKAKNDRKAGNEVTGLTGRALFQFDSTLFVDDANAGGVDELQREDLMQKQEEGEDDDTPFAEYTEKAQEVDQDLLLQMQREAAEQAAEAAAKQAASDRAWAEAKAAAEAAQAGSSSDVLASMDNVDESLFAEEDLDDLDDLDDDDDDDDDATPDSGAVATMDLVDESLFAEEDLPDDLDDIEDEAVPTAQVPVDASLFNEDELPDDDSFLDEEQI